ncbi:carotenoid oxygenase family protein [soil metagenome]
MTSFPDTMHFTGLNTPVRMEVSIRDLPVTGEIPAEIAGAFFRAVPDPAHPPMFDDDHVLSGDGMISRFLIENGSVDYEIRYVRTARYEAERKARRALFGQYRNPFTDDPSVAGVDRTVANTTPLWHANRLFMTKEDGRAYEINPHTLETIGSWDYHGALKSQTMTAHSRVDPDTGELFFFGYEAGGTCSADIAYCIASKDGELVSEQWFAQPYLGMIHDFAITQSRAVFPIFPTTTDVDRLKAGGVKWAHQQDLECAIGIMPRYGKVDEMRWFKGPKGASAFHILNAFDEGDLVHLDICVAETNAFPFMREAGGIQRAQQEIGGGLERWTFDLSKPGEGFDVRPLGPPGDMPRIRDADTGRPYRAGWYLTVNPQGGRPLPGGPVGVAFTALLRIEVGNGGLEMLGLPPGHAINEPVHVPSAAADHDGWLLSVVDRETGENSYASELWIIEAGNVAKGPIARVTIPAKLRAQVHGNWVSAESLANAAAPS